MTFNYPILIGSSAAKYHYPEFREPKDIDYIVKDLKIKSQDKRIDCNYSPAFEWIYNNSQEFVLKNNELIPSPNVLYTIKFSHIFWDVHWPKSIGDIIFFQNKNCQLIEEFFELLYNDWENLKGKRKATRESFDVPNEQLFTKAVDRKYKHDSVHEAIAYYDRPLFERLKIDKSKALILEELFDKLSHEDKIKMIREEAYVLALERFLIPDNFNTNILTAYRRSLKLLIVSLAEKWFAKFMVNNIRELHYTDNYNFVEKFRTSNKLVPEQ